MDHSKAKITMANKLLGIYLIFAYSLALFNAQSTSDTLVLVDNLAIRETHSIFFKGLQGKKMPVNFYRRMFLHMTKTDVSIYMVHIKFKYLKRMFLLLIIFQSEDLN